MDEIAIGIDLGTTNSCVAYLDKFDRLQTIDNEQGKPTTPSYVSFAAEEILVGHGAKNREKTDAKNTVYDVKRLIGKKMNDPMMKNDMEKWPFRVVEDLSRLMVQIEINGMKKNYCAEQISAYILHKLKTDVEKRLNTEVVDAVITVPAAFNDSQRQATIDAGNIAGLNVLKIINEPTAAAIAYGFENKIGDGEHILVYDLGGGTFDVSILKICEKEYEVKCSDGDPHLGGQDFDALIMNEVFKDIKIKYDIDVNENAKMKARIRSSCEELKTVLSESVEGNILIISLTEDIDYEKTITRSFFEKICTPYFQKTIKIVKKCLSDAHLSPSDIDHVVLAGGSSRIPKIQRMLEALFVGKHLNVSSHVDQSIARGAAIQAHMCKTETFDIVLREVASSSLGLELQGGKMFKFIKKNTLIPCSFRKDFYNAADNQTEVHIKIFEGEEDDTRRNRQLGQFPLTNITRAPKNTVRIEVEFSVDENGILHVTASEDSCDGKKSLTIIDRRGRLSQNDIHQFMSQMHQKMSPQ